MGSHGQDGHTPIHPMFNVSHNCALFQRHSINIGISCVFGQNATETLWSLSCASQLYYWGNRLFQVWNEGNSCACMPCCLLVISNWMSIYKVNHGSLLSNAGFQKVIWDKKWCVFYMNIVHAFPAHEDRCADPRCLAPEWANSPCWLGGIAPEPIRPFLWKHLHSNHVFLI